MLRLRDGSNGAAGEIFGRMRPRLLGLVRERLDHSPLRGRIDPEDLVQSVLGTFWKRYRRGEWTPSGLFSSIATGVRS
jgi:DNA-directed RNA polymerase specialized sigma24 family protein